MTMDTKILAYFFTAQDARRAMNALEAMNATVSPPEPVEPPHEGRHWLLTITPVLGGLSALYQDATLHDEVIGIILKFNGSTSAGSVS